MKGEEFKKYLCAEIEEINKYAAKHPELSKEEASKLWVEKYAAEFCKKWKDTN